MEIPFYQVDAFTDRPFAGNPAAVCFLDAWLADDMLQSIGLENNLSETSFLVPTGADEDADYHLRWFTPTVEVDLCGHATLAAGHVVLTHVMPNLDSVTFTTQAGPLVVSRDGDRYRMDFPARGIRLVAMPAGLADALGAVPHELYRSPDGRGDYLAVFQSEAEVAALAPVFQELAALGETGVIATAPGDDVDFVSRFFVPGMGIDEDPVTGSAHTVSAPYWAGKLGRNDLFARQISARGGDLWLEVRDDRVLISGHVVEVITGRMTI